MGIDLDDKDPFQPKQSYDLRGGGRGKKKKKRDGHTLVHSRMFLGTGTRPGAGIAEPSWHGGSALLCRAPAGMESTMGKVHKSKEGLPGPFPAGK